MSDAVVAVVLVFVILIVFVIAFGAFEDGYIKGSKRGRSEVRKEAIERGLGEYRVSSEGHIEFVWHGASK